MKACVKRRERLQIIEIDLDNLPLARVIAELKLDILSAFVDIHDIQHLEKRFGHRLIRSTSRLSDGRRQVHKRYSLFIIATWSAAACQGRFARAIPYWARPIGSKPCFRRMA